MTATTINRTETGSLLVNALETVWASIQGRHPDVPDVVIITGAAFKTGRLVWGHYGHDFWSNGRFVVDSAGVAEREHRPELFVGGEAISKGSGMILETMLHEAAHAVAKVREVKDTSRQNRYHNGEFRKIAEEMGLAWTHERPHKVHGFSDMLLTAETREVYADVTAEMDRAIVLSADLPDWATMLGGTGGDNGTGGGHHGVRKPKDPTPTKPSRMLKATCSCEVPRIIRVARATLEAAPITCGECDSEFTA